MDVFVGRKPECRKIAGGQRKVRKKSDEAIRRKHKSKMIQKSRYKRETGGRYR